MRYKIRTSQNIITDNLYAYKVCLSEVIYEYFNKVSNFTRKLSSIKIHPLTLVTYFITPITPKIGYFFSFFTLFFLFYSSNSLLIPSGSELALLSRIHIPSRY